MEENLTKLTIDELRKYSGLEHLTDEEGEKVIDFIEKLAYVAMKQTLRLENEKLKK